MNSNIIVNQLNSDLSSKIILIHGEPETWKTTVAASFPKALIAATEIGYQFIPGAEAFVIQTLHDIKHLLRLLDTPDFKEKYRTVVIDTLGLFYRICSRGVCAIKEVEDPGDVEWGKGWRRLADEFEVALTTITQLGYGLVMIAHSKEFEVEVGHGKEKEKQVRVEADIDKKAKPLIRGMSDFIFYVRKEYDDEGNEEVYAYSKLPDIETKTRARFFPKRIFFSYASIKESLDMAIREQLVGSQGAEPIVVPTEPAVNPHKKVQIDFEEVKTAVIDMLTELMDTPIEEDVNNYLRELFPDVLISQTTSFHLDRLLAARDYLLGVMKRIEGGN